MVPYQNPYQYILDSSALFDLKRDYPISIFPTLWQNFNELCKNGHIVAPREVLREINKGNDELVEWAGEFEHMFLEPTDKEVDILREVMKYYPPKVIEKYGTNPWADPLIVSAAKHFRLPIIQHETTDPNQHKIPTIAAKFDVKCIRLVNLFDEQSWKF
jgi:hypothetical protein